jgi:hypothetical protein
MPKRRIKPGIADIHQRVRREGGVPHRRYAWLAIGALALEDEQLAQRRRRSGAVWMVGFVTEAVEHHQRVGHGGENPTQPVLAVEPFGDERDRLVDRPSARVCRKHRLSQPQQTVDDRKGVPDR